MQSKKEENSLYQQFMNLNLSKRLAALQLHIEENGHHYGSTYILTYFYR
jgi:hypothetical protein